MKKEELPQEIPVGHSKDLTGQCFGKLNVLYRCNPPEGIKNKSRAYWVCKCECLNVDHEHYTIVRGDHLTSEHTRSCGEASEWNLQNKRFGKLVALEPIKEKGKTKRWKCQCDCGRTCKVLTTKLTQNITVECPHCSSFIDLTGQCFGRLIVLRKMPGVTSNHSTLWECQCTCPQKNKIIVSSNNLRAGHTQSCGCLVSKGEAKIKQILQENNVSFIAQKTFDDCIVNDSSLRFDFYLPEYNCCIEYDGRQHYITEETGFFTKEVLQGIKERDIFKNNWCKEHNVQLKRIPYWEYKNLTYENLIDDTFVFIK